MPTARELAIPIPHEKVAAFCRKWGVRRLAFFGSVVRADFDPERSDVDVLVEFDPRSPNQPRGLEIVKAENELAAIIGRKVDLGEFHMLNRWIRKDVLIEAVDEYVAS
ncbi:MAG TPA: nucleotidyltransferase domain-containing protein [Thermoanaerobaculia bacterium]|nr:nucleotidyltransferase domain-containing protein [Thermoanaerobaculia bacterium]